MYIFNVIFNLMCLSKNSVNNKNRYNSFLKHNNFLIKDSNTTNSGNDERPNIKDNEDLNSIYINFHKKNILETLENNNIGIFHKLELINKYDILNETISVNILKGGLLDDFNFEIF